MKYLHGMRISRDFFDDEEKVLMGLIREEGEGREMDDLGGVKGEVMRVNEKEGWAGVMGNPMFGRGP